MPPQAAIAVIGVGGIGINAIHQIVNGRKIILADFSQDALDSAAKPLRLDGHVVDTQKVDISKHDEVLAFAKACTETGHLESLIHTAGLSPNAASAERIFQVDLLGTANILEAFLQVAQPGLTIVCIASMAAYHGGDSITKDLETHLATAPLDRLLDHPEIASAKAYSAYAVSKRGNILRVQALAKAYGLKGARVNTVSPGVISTPMTQYEFTTSQGDVMRSMIEMSPAARIGTPQDVANAVEFLTSTRSSFITGNDLLVDGGGWAASRWTGQGS